MYITLFLRESIAWPLRFTLPDDLLTVLDNHLGDPICTASSCIVNEKKKEQGIRTLNAPPDELEEQVVDDIVDKIKTIDDRNG